MSLLRTVYSVPEAFQTMVLIRVTGYPLAHRFANVFCYLVEFLAAAYST